MSDGNKDQRKAVASNALLAVGDVLHARRSGGKLAGHYFGDVTISSVAGKYASVRGKIAWGNVITVQVTLEELDRWGRVFAKGEYGRP